VCGFAFIVAAGLYAWLQARDSTGPARWLAAANPVVITIALMALAIPFDWGRSFVAPAAPNLAHVAFFLLWSSARLAVASEVE
jgi:hypothetical protein